MSLEWCPRQRLDQPSSCRGSHKESSRRNAIHQEPKEQPYFRQAAPCPPRRGIQAHERKSAWVLFPLQPHLPSQNLIVSLAKLSKACCLSRKSSMNSFAASCPLGV